MADAPSRDQNKFIIRMPDGLRERIRAAAEKNNRSMNSEIVGTLESFYPERMSLEDIRNYIAQLVDGYRHSPAEDLLTEIADMIQLLGEKLPIEDSLAYRAMNEDPETEDWNREHPDNPTAGSIAHSKMQRGKS
ncbi:Arc family DNA-binding protein [Shinella zoogloeoides]|uniref:Arc family DNA-binding protein n=1 Tax=Shinella zoogloeoides TaxID=352475 RepID=UPI00299F2E34|nr:Arc family DNA-binding protein [Shinella zoogloeoides]WPE22502.1 hypothetical protein ShzoTeo12_37180 [Shinella zoogloeoides]